MCALKSYEAGYLVLCKELEEDKKRVDDLEKRFE